VDCTGGLTTVTIVKIGAIGTIVVSRISVRGALTERMQPESDAFLHHGMMQNNHTPCAHTPTGGMSHVWFMITLVIMTILTDFWLLFMLLILQ
jgi:hypothetical protein